MSEEKQHDRDAIEASRSIPLLDCVVAKRVDGTHIYFDFATRSKSGKTLEYHVMTKDDTDCLGSVNWFGRWRCYSFNPWPGTVFEKVCLREIADFCERLTKEHRQQKKAI